MPTFISFCRWTSEGSHKVKDSPARLDAAREALRAFGVTIKDFYLTTGQYDMVVITEAADDAAIAKAMLALMSKGSVTTETVRAFSEAEYRAMIQGLP